MKDIPKTKSGKILRRILREILEGNKIDKLSDVSTIQNKDIIKDIYKPFPIGSPGGIDGYPSGAASIRPRDDWKTAINGAAKGKDIVNKIRKSLVWLFICFIEILDIKTDKISL